MSGIINTEIQYTLKGKKFAMNDQYYLIASMISAACILLAFKIIERGKRSGIRNMDNIDELKRPQRILWDDEHDSILYTMADGTDIMTKELNIDELGFNGYTMATPARALIEQETKLNVKEAIYIILSCKEISPLKVQAILYYIYGCGLVLQHREIFKGKFEATPDGIFETEIDRILGREDDLILPSKPEYDDLIYKDPDAYALINFICTLYRKNSGEEMMGFLKHKVPYCVAMNTDRAIDRDVVYSAFNITISKLAKKFVTGEILARSGRM